MRSFFHLLAYHVRSLARFSGRDSRPTFWPWAITLALAAMIAMSALMVPVMIGMTALARQYPDQSRIEIGPGHYSVQIDGGVPGAASLIAPMVVGIAGIAAIIIPLVAASVARRLHDRGKSGAWGLLPLPFLTIAFLLFPRMFGSVGMESPPEGLFFAGVFNNFVYVAALGYLVVLLIRDGDRGANRYGPPPDPPTS